MFWPLSGRFGPWLRGGAPGSRRPSTFLAWCSIAACFSATVTSSDAATGCVVLRAFARSRTLRAARLSIVTLPARSYGLFGFIACDRYPPSAGRVFRTGIPCRYRIRSGKPASFPYRGLLPSCLDGIRRMAPGFAFELAEPGRGALDLVGFIGRDGIRRFPFGFPAAGTLRVPYPVRETRPVTVSRPGNPSRYRIPSGKPVPLPCPVQETGSVTVLRVALVPS